jgi:hypothetical protein
MVRNKKVIKVDVEKSEYVSCKTVTIRNMKNEIIAELNVFRDGSIFVHSCNDVYVAENKIKKIILEAPTDGCSTYYQHITMVDEYNTVEINRKARME